MTQATEQTIDSEGWLHSGDLATMDEDGYINIVGRIKDMIIRGGENVYPKEIEAFIQQFDEVLDVQVIGVQDEKFGEEICAYIRLKEGCTPIASLRDRFKGNIAHYKVPKYVLYVDEFPLTATGKIQKYKMREQFHATIALDKEKMQSITIR